MIKTNLMPVFYYQGSAGWKFSELGHVSSHLVLQCAAPILFIFTLRKSSKGSQPEILTENRPPSPAKPAGRDQHLPLQAFSSLSSKQSRKPSHRSESTMQASPSSHLNSLLIQVKVLCVAETQKTVLDPEGKSHVIQKTGPRFTHIQEKQFEFFKPAGLCLKYTSGMRKRMTLALWYQLI